MKACYFQGIEILRISGLKLLSLTMARWIECEFYKMEISVQKIMFFSFDYSKMLDFSVKRKQLWKKRKAKASSQFVRISWGPCDAEFVTLDLHQNHHFLSFKTRSSGLIIYFLN